MIALTVPNRPFATDAITGLQLPDGIFEASLGQQRVNAHFTNTGGAAINNAQVYIESVSHPSIAIIPATYPVPQLSVGAARLLYWDADFSNVPPGVYHISFIAEGPGGDRSRSIKKIFVTRTEFDPATTTFTAATPEGVLAVRFADLVGPKDGCCGRKPSRRRGRRDTSNFLTKVSKLFRGHDPNFEFCPPGYLPRRMQVAVTPTPPYAGQYGDLPYNDPWWKVVLCIVAVALLIAAAIVASQEGGEVVVTTDGGGGGGAEDCCGVEAQGGSSSYVVAGLVAAAAAAATLAGYSDARDPFRRGQDNTAPAAGELTLAERLTGTFAYGEPVALGKPFSVGAKWEYTRVTTGATYTHAVTETNPNTHVLSTYKVTAPDVVRLYRRELFIVRAQFFDADGKALRGSDLLVQCFLAGPQGQFRSFILQDDGVPPDDEPGDGIYTGRFQFAGEEPDPRGLWMFYVIAQDINNARADMAPEDQARIIGGVVVTHQLAITFDSGTCALVPDGHVNVI